MKIERPDWPSIRVKLEVLFLKTFGRPIAPGYLDWRYFDNGQKFLLFDIEIMDGEPVASYSAFPVELACNGQKYSSAMSMTTMTHPDWRGKGLFQKLASALYVEAGVLQISAVWGFPNSASHPLFKGKLGWTDVYEIPTLRLDVNEVDTSSFRTDPRIGTDNAFCLHYPDAPEDDLIRVHRSRDYLVWRYTKNPVNEYQNYVLSFDGCVSSYVVTKAYEDGIDLVDIQPSTQQEAHVIISHILKVNCERGIKHFSCWAPTHHFVHAILEKFGFKNTAPVTYFGGRELIVYGMPTGWTDYKNWYIQMGDSDVY